MNELDKKLEEFVRLVNTCEWNNLNYKKVPAYKIFKKELMSLIKDLKEEKK